MQGAYRFVLAKDISIDPREIFQHFCIRSERQGYKIIRYGASSRRIHYYSTLVETRGRKSKVTGAQIQEADHILQDEGLELEGKRYTWKQLAMEIGADVVGRTMYNVMSDSLNYEKCLACVKGWLPDPPMERRVEFAHIMLTRYPKPEQ